MRNSDNSNFEFLDKLFNRLVGKEERGGSDSLGPEERILMIVWHASGIIENGGFQYFYEQSLDTEAVAAAYKRIGCNRCAELLRLSASLFPDGNPQPNWDGRIDFIERNGDLFERLSEAFWEADQQMTDHLAEFVRKHPEAWV